MNFESRNYRWEIGYFLPMVDYGGSFEFLVLVCVLFCWYIGEIYFSTKSIRQIWKIDEGREDFGDVLWFYKKKKNNEEIV